MAKTRSQSNGRLEEAMAALVQSQATLVQNQAAFQAQLTEMERLRVETDRRWIELREEAAARFARIENLLLEHSRILADHSRILADHSRILEALPELVREKIGFKIPKPSASSQ